MNGLGATIQLAGPMTAGTWIIALDGRAAGKGTHGAARGPSLAIWPISTPALYRGVGLTVLRQA